MKRLVTTTMMGIGLAVAAAGCAGGGGNESDEFPVEVTSERVSKGRTIYAANCASCHGLIGEPPPLSVAPPHDAESPQSHTWHHADRQLFGWILDRPPLATLMPSFRGTLSEQDVRDVIAYIKSEWPEDIRSRQEQFSREYEQQFREFGP